MVAFILKSWLWITHGYLVLLFSFTSLPYLFHFPKWQLHSFFSHLNSLHLYCPTLPCQLVALLHSSLKLNKTYQRGTLPFPDSKTYNVTCICSYRSCLHCPQCGWYDFIPIKVNPSTYALGPIPYRPCKDSMSTTLHFPSAFSIDDYLLNHFHSRCIPVVMSPIFAFGCPSVNYTFCG